MRMTFTPIFAPWLRRWSKVTEQRSGRVGGAECQSCCLDTLPGPLVCTESVAAALGLCTQLEKRTLPACVCLGLLEGSTDELEFLPIHGSG